MLINPSVRPSTSEYKIDKNPEGGFFARGRETSETKHSQEVAHVR